MSVRDYIHPSWLEAWDKVRAGFSPVDNGPYVDDESVKQLPSATREWPMEAYDHMQASGELAEVLVHDGWYLDGPTGQTPATGATYLDEHGRKWRISRVEMYQKKSRLGGWDRNARIWVKPEPA